MSVKPEILSPAGSLDALKAAVYAGADAVYFGADKFNARMNACNFAGETLKEAFDFCRLYGVKAYITLNTLLSDREILQAEDEVEELCKFGPPDALIIQDCGLAGAIHRDFPDLPIHASTQAVCHNSLHFPYLKVAGFSRVVLAREMKKEDIIKAASAGLETEIFIHGAICVCQSGGCLMSSLIGNRSGNRGECAQPCRLPCKNSKNPSPLSLKDMCLASHMTEILSSGVGSLKIEGRMKSPEYVFAVTKVYRELVDESRNATEKELSYLADIFSRSGFTDGYFTGKLCPDMFGVRTQKDKIRTDRTPVSVEKSFIPIEISASAFVGKPAFAQADYKNHKVCVSGEIGLPAQNRPLTEEDFSKRMKKTGQTVFRAKKVECRVGDGVFLPIDKINSLRNNLTEKLEKEILADRKEIKRIRKEKPALFALSGTEGKGNANIMRFEGRFPDEKSLALVMPSAARIDVPLHKIRKIDNPENFAFVLPRVIFDSDINDIKALLKKAKSFGYTKAVLPSVSFIPLCEGFELHGDYLLNIYNTQTLEYIKSLGFASAFISPEAPKARFDGCDFIEKQYLFYGRCPVMHTQNCIIRNITGKCLNKADCFAYLTDRTDEKFLIFREYAHRNTIYNSRKSCMFNKKSRFEGEFDLRCFMFTDESPDEIKKVLSGFESGTIPFEKYKTLYI